MTTRSLICGIIAVIYLGGFSMLPVAIGVAYGNWWYVAFMFFPCLFCLLASIGLGVDIATQPKQQADFRREVEETLDREARAFDKLIAQILEKEAAK